MDKISARVIDLPGSLSAVSSSARNFRQAATQSLTGSIFHSKTNWGQGREPRQPIALRDSGLKSATRREFGLARLTDASVNCCRLPGSESS